MSPAVSYRFSGFLAIACMTTASTYRPTSGLMAEGGCGDSRTCWYATATGDSPVNGGAPATISYRTQPAEYRSDRASTVSPRACSGLRYWAVPSTDEVLVRVELASLTARAMPKSMTLTAPSREIMMFAGLTSRWMIPFLCEKSRAPQTSAITPSARSTSNGPSILTMSRIVSPSTSSMTM